jgi:hypothetical protein
MNREDLQRLLINLVQFNGFEFRRWFQARVIECRSSFLPANIHINLHRPEPQPIAAQAKSRLAYIGQPQAL